MENQREGENKTSNKFNPFPCAVVTSITISLMCRYVLTMMMSLLVCVIDDCHGNFSVTQESVPQTEAAAADNMISDTKEPAKVVLTFFC